MPIKNYRVNENKKLFKHAIFSDEIHSVKWLMQIL